MSEHSTSDHSTVCRLGDDANNRVEKVQTPASLNSDISTDCPLLVVLAAGKGTRFGQVPKCAQLVKGVPLARHSINAFQEISASPAVCLIGYRHDEVSAALGDDNIYVLSDNPTGGTAFAAFEALSVPGLLEKNPLLVITMGDRVVSASMFKRLIETHSLGNREADLTLLTAIYEPPKNHGKGRIVRDELHKIVQIVEQRDIDATDCPNERNKLLATTEGNCPLYIIRATTLHEHLQDLSNDNAQSGQYYITDLVERIHRIGGDIRTVTTSSGEPDYDLLCSDVTRPMDLALLESALAAVSVSHSDTDFDDPKHAARAIRQDRHPGQIAAIAAQLEELASTADAEQLEFKNNLPIGIGISGGRLRIACMHPDMGRFYGPAWQMPIGAIDATGREQIVMLVQASDDEKIHLFPTNPQFRERLNYINDKDDLMYPGSEVEDLYSYEGFGTKMAENLLLSLGYFTEQELAARTANQQPLPPPGLWVSNSMRRPFSLVGNAIASMRTLREGNLGARVQTFLGRDGFKGLRVMSTGNIPRGGFSSSSAVTVAVKNAINTLFELNIPPDMLVHLACQAEYGTGVRAGAADQATLQKGRLSEGTLISSNPRENYRIIGTYPVPGDRFQVLFPYSIDRDREAWKWSAGAYASTSEPDRLTAAEMRKMTGKAAELSAILVRLPLETDFFQMIEEDLVNLGELTQAKHKWVCDQLVQIPLLASQEELRQSIYDNRSWYIEQLMATEKLDAASASEKADATFESLFTGWRTPSLKRSNAAGHVIQEKGVPLRAMVAYLFGEVAKNLYLIHHPEKWIEYVTRSQGGDRSFNIELDRVPTREEMTQQLAWEAGLAGAALMEHWLTHCAATPVNYNDGLDDASLSSGDMQFHQLVGSNFFRSLALIDLVEAMLKRAFGEDAIAVRVNAAGQGDFFQVHVDTQAADVADVKQFIESAFYDRFGLSPETPFVELHSGAGAVGIRISRFDQLPQLISELARVDE
jgi:molybdopterin-guanine dinucleotide biosynthesis protein A